MMRRNHAAVHVEVFYEWHMSYVIDSHIICEPVLSVPTDINLAVVYERINRFLNRR
jgi:hypothetical protein